MRENPLGRDDERSLVACDETHGLSSSNGEDATGDATMSSSMIIDGDGAGGPLCRCNAVVGGIFVTCLMNVAMAR
jgi:hypothetical protein